ncbi:class I tRNA ligase family protein [Candidatus Parcubacteria bacterium]|nr:class I tRNA ligase family protein [Candidatus Parcubacteria bacterium]
MHQTIKKVSDDVETLGFNTAVSALMIWVNALEKQEQVSKEEFETLLKLLAPFAPHVAEELWRIMGHGTSIHQEPWPKHDDSRLAPEEVVIVVQVNGKVRGKFVAPAAVSEAEAVERAKSLPEVVTWLEGKAVGRAVYVPRKLVNFVLS